MEQNGTIGGGALTLLGQNDCTPQSIVKALDNFLRAVQQMREVVMVPSRLKDMTFVSFSQILYFVRHLYMFRSSMPDH